MNNAEKTETLTCWWEGGGAGGVAAAVMSVTTSPTSRGGGGGLGGGGVLCWPNRHHLTCHVRLVCVSVWLC